MSGLMARIGAASTPASAGQRHAEAEHGRTQRPTSMPRARVSSGRSVRPVRPCRPGSGSAATTRRRRAHGDAEDEHPVGREPEQPEVELAAEPRGGA